MGYPPRPDPNEYDELVIPVDDNPRDGTGAAFWLMVSLGFTVASGFIWAFIEVGL